MKNFLKFVGSRLFGRKSAVLSMLVLAGFVGGCSREPSTKPVAEDRSWFIESWDNGAITVRHEGKVYKATCYAAVLVKGSVSPSYGDFVPDEQDVIHEPCLSGSPKPLAAEFVGRNIQPFPPKGSNFADQKQRDADGYIVVMDDPGITIKLLSWKERSPWRQENYRITSITKRW
jgi:hypothetical protein